jgi:nucleoside-diphosphate kinase
MTDHMAQRTLAIIKPDATGNKYSGPIISMIESTGLAIIGMKMVHLTQSQASRFYAVHTGKPFFEKLTEFMTSGKIIVLALEGENAIKRWRAAMGATDPAKAEEGTIRKRFGSSVTYNACHGSDAPETAETEISFFFNDDELITN